nr:hypothetical protein [Tanacetum cinerariifolium]
MTNVLKTESLIDPVESLGHRVTGSTGWTAGSTRFFHVDDEFMTVNDPDSCNPIMVNVKAKHDMYEVFAQITMIRTLMYKIIFLHNALLYTTMSTCDQENRARTCYNIQTPKVINSSRIYRVCAIMRASSNSALDKVVLILLRIDPSQCTSLIQGCIYGLPRRTSFNEEALCFPYSKLNHKDKAAAKNPEWQVYARVSEGGCVKVVGSGGVEQEVRRWTLQAD